MVVATKESTDVNGVGKHSANRQDNGGDGTPPSKKAKPSDVLKEKVWKNEDGTVETIIELEDEPRHHVEFVNDYTKIIVIKMVPGDTTLPHRHARDTLIFVMMKDGIEFMNDVLFCGKQKGFMNFGQVGFAPYTSSPCVHRITNLSPTDMFVVNVEVIERPPVSQEKALPAGSSHSLVKTQDNCRVYKLVLDPGESTTVSYRFFYVRVVLQGSLVETSLGNHTVSWEENLAIGDCHWKEPCVDMTIKNLGDSVYEAYVCEMI
jgi:hypothetical protein